jgi:m7GpppX diphosphatase
VFGDAEKERVLIRKLDANDGFVLVINPHWNTHPDPCKHDIKQLFVVSPQLDREFIRDLNYLVIVERCDLKSLRDLRAEHIELLMDIQKTCLEKIEQIYGLDRKYVRVFVHYFPQFYHFHGKVLSNSFSFFLIF